MSDMLQHPSASVAMPYSTDSATPPSSNVGSGGKWPLIIHAPAAATRAAIAIRARRRHFSVAPLERSASTMIASADSALVAGSDPSEHETIRKNFLIKKLGLADGPELQSGLDAVLETYGTGERRKHRPVVYYLLVKHFGKEAVYA